ncbi:endoglucanase [Microbacterium halimionae]|uniref:Glucanase n=1 Tax=Microbacterium halimionae TaxID=1526413 RepID=A0A7W3JQ20_9MICO|nr:glycoside hydrolase family 6 protein [Microbacterium halimionae]MBA8816856.1 endoglucanase [Microbacterium halimionae]NII94848.1 endoglucanase [Microbacterium halimionae]
MTTAPAASRRRRSLPRWVWISIVAAALVIILAVIAAIGWTVTTGLSLLNAEPPGVGTTIVAPAESKASLAAESASEGTEEFAAAAYLAAAPTAYWLTPELDPIGDVGARVLNLANEARDQDAALAVVIYGLPERDCGQYSAGGLDDADYDTWTTEIGSALSSAGAADIQKIIILEPDSLALAPQCDNVNARMTQLHDAVDRLAGTNTWIYLDGGHSNWLPASEMASLIQQVDVSDAIRGFATNVSNYQPTYAEFEYAHQISDALGGSHAIVDTSRNGADQAESDWCNPSGQLIGAAGGAYGDDVVDTNLWVKPPGESDGECNGGPVAGAWWPESAVELTTNVVQ